MEFSYAGSNGELLEAAQFANLLPEGFYQAIADEPSFTNTNLSPAQICDRLRACSTIVTVRDWTPEADETGYEKTVALVRPSLPFVILYHSKFHGRSVAQKVNTLVHEFVHVVDRFSDGDASWNYTHNGQSPGGNERSAPYRIGDIAEAFYLQANSQVGLDQLLPKSFAAEADFVCGTPDEPESEAS